MKTSLRWLMAKRQVFIDREEAYYDQFTDEELGSDDCKEYNQDPECENLRLQIIEFINTNRNLLSIEDIFEGLSSIGAAPTLLNDDMGNWAVGGDGMQGLSIGKKASEDCADFSGTWFLKKKQWKKTIREAVNEYLDR